MVFDGRGGRIAIVALDLVGYFNAEVQTIRALVDPATWQFLHAALSTKRR